MLDRTAIRLNAFNRKRKRLGEDLCTISGPSLVKGGGAGDSLNYGTLATNVECFVEALGESSQDLIGGQSYVSSHRLEMPRTATTSAITPEHQIKVTTRNWFFEHPIIRQGSFAPLVVLNASRVEQGYDARS